MSSSADSAQQRVVIVIGPGRSGTSTVAGTLQHLGLTVPGPAIKGNKTNPSGFFEPRWVVDFHRRLLDRAVVHTLDPSPAALERATKAAARPAARDRLRRWLSDRLAETPQLIVKDPRTVWFRDLWVETAEELGVSPGFVTMLRHPAEVSGSRQKYYAKSDPSMLRSDDVFRVAGWINVALIAEQVSRGSQRRFVRYTDLIKDWRRVMGEVQSSLDLSYDPGVDVSPHPVDAFVDPSLHRVQVDWDDVQVPASLRDIGEGVWQSLVSIADGEDEESAVDKLEGVRQEYAVVDADAEAIARQAIHRARIDARRNANRTAKSGSGKRVEPVAAGRSVWRKLTGGRT